LTEDAAALERIHLEERGRVLATLIRLLGDFDLAEEALLMDGGEPRGVVAVRARAHELRSAAEVRRARP